MAQKQMLMVMKRLLPALLAVVVVLSLSFVHVGLGADREGVGFKITLGSGKHPQYQTSFTPSTGMAARHYPI